MEMRYEYREVKCPWCGHIFMWEKHGAHDLESSIFLYTLKTTGEEFVEAKCPSCERRMLVLDHILEGIDNDDDRFEKGILKGI